MLFILYALLISIKIAAMPAPATLFNQTTLTLAHKKLTPEPLYMQLDPAFHDKSVRQIYALAEQVDKFSCAYRTFFHARCIDIANERVKKGETFDKSLQELLRNIGMLNEVTKKIGNYFDTYDVFFDRAQGMYVSHIPGICAIKIRKLRGKILPIMLGDDGKTITVLHDENAKPENPLAYSYYFIKNCNSFALPFDQCKMEIDKSPELAYQLAKLSEPSTVVHFACQFPNHMFLASMITDANKNVSLHVIDSNNINAYAKKEFKTIVSKLLTYVELLNNKNKKP